MDSDTQEIPSSSFSDESDELIPNTHCSHLKPQKKYPPHFSYHLVKNSQRGALFIIMANIFLLLSMQF